MKKTTAFLRNVRQFGPSIAIMGALTAQSFATAGAVETAVTAAVTDAKAAGEAVLAGAATVVGGFLLFKLAKRAANRA